MGFASAFRAWKLRVAAAATMIFALAAPALAQTKVALIIGNGAYRNVPAIPNPPNDAADVAAGFLRLGFSVRLVTDASYDTMRRALLEFTPKARDSEMAIIFFAGHGIEVGGENWLIPTDAELKADLDTEQEAISLRSVMLMVSSASRLGLVVLDACRNNPFLAKMRRSIATRAVSRGLSAIEPMNNVLVAYAAKDGTTAADGDGRNSPFTAALLKHLGTPGLEINFLFRNVRDDVITATNGEQQPFIYGSLSREAIYLRQPAAAAGPPGADQAAWSLLKDTIDANALKRFMAQYPTSTLREDAEARIATIEARQSVKPATSAADEIAWALLKDTTDEAALKRFLARYPDSALRKDAETRIAALEKAAAPPERGAVPSSVADPHELTRLLQFELKRVGCFNGAVNGDFDEQTRAAARVFGSITSIKMPEELSPDLIKAVRGFDKRVCPLVCADGTRARGERCGTVVPAREPLAKKEGVEREAPHRQATKSSERKTVVHPHAAAPAPAGAPQAGSRCRMTPEGGIHNMGAICD